MFAKNQPRSPATIRSCNRSSGRLSSGFWRADIARSIALLLYSREEAILQRQNRVAHAHAARNRNGPVHAERQRFVPAFAAIARERAERVEIGDAAIRVVRGDDTTADVAVQDDRRVADAHLRAEPLVLFVRRHAVDLEEHAEAASVDRLGRARFLAQSLERPARDE